MGNPSATEAMNGAIERARALLFPARLEKWLALGFIAFLAGLGESGGSYSFRWPFPGGSPPSGSPKSTAPEKIFGESWRDALAWAGEHTGLVIALGSGMLLLGVALAVLLIWLSSRGKLMFVESVIHDRYQVKEPWERLREPAWAIFKFRLILGIIGLSAAVKWVADKTVESLAAHDLDLARSWVIGCGADEIEAGARAGCNTVYVGDPDDGVDRSLPDLVAHDLLDAAGKIMGSEPFSGGKGDRSADPRDAWQQVQSARLAQCLGPFPQVVRRSREDRL